MKAFFSEIEKNLVSVIVPSDFVKNAITECFPEFSKKVFVRPHLIITGKTILRFLEKFELRLQDDKVKKKDLKNGVT